MATIDDFGFDKNLNKKIEIEGDSSAYNVVEDTLNKFVSSETLTNFIPGLPEAEKDGL